MIKESKKKSALREYISSGKSLAEVAKNHSMAPETLRRYSIEKSAVRKSGRPKEVRGVTPARKLNIRTTRDGLNFVALADLVRSHGIKISIVMGSSGTNIKMES
jgi:transposase-like protein